MEPMAHLIVFDQADGQLRRALVVLGGGGSVGRLSGSESDCLGHSLGHILLHLRLHQRRCARPFGLRQSTAFDPRNAILECPT